MFIIPLAAPTRSTAHRGGRLGSQGIGAADAQTGSKSLGRITPIPRSEASVGVSELSRIAAGTGLRTLGGNRNCTMPFPVPPPPDNIRAREIKLGGGHRHGDRECDNECSSLVRLASAKRTPRRNSYSRLFADLSGFSACLNLGGIACWRASCEAENQFLPI